MMDLQKWECVCNRVRIASRAVHDDSAAAVLSKSGDVDFGS